MLHWISVLLILMLTFALRNEKLLLASGEHFGNPVVDEAFIAVRITSGVNGQVFNGCEDPSLNEVW